MSPMRSTKTRIRYRCETVQRGTVVYAIPLNGPVPRGTFSCLKIGVYRRPKL